MFMDNKKLYHFLRNKQQTETKQNIVLEVEWGKKLGIKRSISEKLFCNPNLY